MTYAPSSVELAQGLVRCNTISGGDERQALEPLARILSDAGFSVVFDAYDPSNPQRCSLSARLRPDGDQPALCLCGHIDTVPLGAAGWRMYLLDWINIVQTGSDRLGSFIEEYCAGENGECDFINGP